VSTVFKASNSHNITIRCSAQYMARGKIICNCQTLNLEQVQLQISKSIFSQMLCSPKTLYLHDLLMFCYSELTLIFSVLFFSSFLFRRLESNSLFGSFEPYLIGLPKLNLLILNFNQFHNSLPPYMNRTNTNLTQFLVKCNYFTGMYPILDASFS